MSLEETHSGKVVRLLLKVGFPSTFPCFSPIQPPRSVCPFPCLSLVMVLSIQTLTLNVRCSKLAEGHCFTVPEAERAQKVPVVRSLWEGERSAHPIPPLNPPHPLAELGNRGLGRMANTGCLPRKHQETKDLHRLQNLVATGNASHCTNCVLLQSDKMFPENTLSLLPNSRPSYEIPGEQP